MRSRPFSRTGSLGRISPSTVQMAWVVAIGAPKPSWPIWPGSVPYSQLDGQFSTFSPGSSMISTIARVAETPPRLANRTAGVKVLPTLACVLGAISATRNTAPPTSTEKSLFADSAPGAVSAACTTPLVPALAPGTALSHR